MEKGELSWEISNEAEAEEAGKGEREESGVDRKREKTPLGKIKEWR